MTSSSGGGVVTAVLVFQYMSMVSPIHIPTGTLSMVGSATGAAVVSGQSSVSVANGEMAGSTGLVRRPITVQYTSVTGPLILPRSTTGAGSSTGSANVIGIATANFNSGVGASAGSATVSGVGFGATKPVNGLVGGSMVGVLYPRPMLQYTPIVAPVHLPPATTAPGTSTGRGSAAAVGVGVRNEPSMSPSDTGLMYPETPFIYDPIVEPVLFLPPANAQMRGTSTGLANVLGIGTGVVPATGVSSGAAVDAAVGIGLSGSTGVSVGAALDNAVSALINRQAGTATGAATANIIALAITAIKGTAAGQANVFATPSAVSTISATGASTGAGVVSGIATFIVAAVGVSSGAGVGHAVGVADITVGSQFRRHLQRRTGARTEEEL